jgi:uncharacterized protein YegL
VRLVVFTAHGGDPRVVYALLRLAAEADEHSPTRRPVNLALVIDRSSSMRGPRLAQAVRAVRRLLTRLDDRDRLAVVAFDGAAKVLVPPGPVNAENRAKLDAELSRLRTGAGTNLAAGWKKGCELVAAAFVREAYSRVILLTDGLPSVGTRDAAKLGDMAEAEAARGISTTTMGIGDGFDDELLGDIAARGKGGFYYLANEESIPAAFGRELAGVFAIAARNVELKIIPEADVMSCEVLHRLTTRPTPEGMVIEVGEIAAGAPRQVLLRLTRGAGARGALVAKVVVQREGAAPHLDRIPAPNGNALELAEVTVERLRVQAAVAVDEAWARRATGHRDEAVAGIGKVREEIGLARAKGIALEGLRELDGELAGTQTALEGAVRELDRHRRASRERSHVTMLGQSLVRPRPEGDDDGD